MKALFPTRALALFVAIGLIDLVSTAVLHSQGLIVELNPIMNVLIQKSEWLFALGKGATIFVGWYAMRWYAAHNRDFVRKASLWGSGVYLFVWSCWFFGALITQHRPNAVEVAPVSAPAEEPESSNLTFV
ncbi:MAG: DUF5658 family protein [Fimbriimonadaceae bacterium]